MKKSKFAIQSQFSFLMKKIIDAVLSILFLFYFGILLLIFHLAQVIALNIFGKKAHQRIVNLLNFFIVKGWLLTGTTTSYRSSHLLPKDRTILFVANHASMFDIPGIIWYLRHHTPLFVSKIELAKGIPSISYNLRNGGAALIDRKDRKQALLAISNLAIYAKENKFSIAIFPEGTRSRNGKLKDFASGGIAIILKKCPEALVVPIAITNTGVFNPKGFFPLTSFTRLHWQCLTPIEPQGLTAVEVVAQAKLQIQEELEK